MTLHFSFNTDLLHAPTIDRARAKTIAAEWRENAQKSGIGFMQMDLLEASLLEASRVVSAIPFTVKTHLVIGIGGSSLGARTILSALPTQTVNTIFLESTDPTCVSHALAQISFETTLISVVSKSGNTLETLSLFFVILENLKAAVSDWKSHVIVITDPETGHLREFVRAEGVASVPVPPRVGGRFSVLTAVGFVPALVSGVDAADLLLGARAVCELSQEEDPEKNPALALAMWQFHFQKNDHRTHTIVMPYTERLREFTDWTAQLLAESVGKKRDRAGGVVYEGFTTLKALGSVDQHSQCQLYLEGPRDKWAIVMTVKTVPTDFSVTIPNSLATSWSWLSGKTLQTILNAQGLATARALSEQGVPTLVVEIDRLTPRAIGELFFLFELMTAYLGELYNINVFDQPAVERIKVLTVDALKAL